MISRTFAVLVALVLLSGCARVITQDEFETCLWGGAVAGAAVGSFGGVAGSAGGAAAGAAIGAFTCGDVGPDQPAVEPVMEKPLDSDGDGVPDSHDRCAGTPTGVKVGRHGCPRDSDGDGVADYLDQCPGTPAGVAVDKTGCPLAGEVLMTLRGVNFAHDSARLSGGSQAILDAAVQVLKQNRKVSVDVVGHTDSQGSESYNQGLSERRASAVRDYLIANGIDGNRLHARGEGESSPVASNATREGRASNRRVELVTQ